MNIDSIVQHDPFRVPHWRWALAGRLVAEGRRAHSLDDPLVAEVLRFRRRLGGSERTRQRATAEAPELAAVHRLYEAGGSRVRELEGRVLAGETADEIAARLKMNTRDVHLYCQVFFDVDLRAKDWIARQVLGLPRGPQIVDERWLWRWAGWHGGPALLELLIEASRGHFDEQQQQLAEAVRELARFTLIPLDDYGRTAEAARHLRRLTAPYRRRRRSPQDAADDPGARLSLQVQRREFEADLAVLRFYLQSGPPQERPRRSRAGEPAPAKATPSKQRDGRARAASCLVPA